LGGSIFGLAELCFSHIEVLKPDLILKFSRKSYETLLCYEKNDFKSLEAAMKLHKNRRTGNEHASLTTTSINFDDDHDASYDNSSNDDHDHDLDHDHDNQATT